MSIDEILTVMQEERDEFEQQVFEMLFGADARPPMTVEEYGEAIPRVFSYEDAREALAEASKSLELLYGDWGRLGISFGRNRKGGGR